MAQEPKFPFLSSPFASLVVEIRQSILSELSDAKTLHAAVTADIYIQDAFFGYAPLILENVLQKQIPSDVLPEALAVLASSHFDSARGVKMAS